MEELIILEDAPVVVPNEETKNFTATLEILKKGTAVKGEEKYITGMKKGAPFTYRLFRLENGKLIFLNKVKPNPKQHLKNNENMEKTEVTLGADGAVINMKPAEVFSKLKITGLVVGAIGAILYCKHKKHPVHVKAVVLGAVIGYAVAFAVDYAHGVTVTKVPGAKTI